MQNDMELLLLDSFLEVPVIRMMLYWGPLTFGQYQSRLESEGGLEQSSA